MESRRLPVEVLEWIIQNLVPSNQEIALPASHPSTQTLLSCSRACRAITSCSERLLYQRCLHIDCAWRLKSLLRAYSPSSHASCRQRQRNSTSLFLAPFRSETLAEISVLQDIYTLFGILAHNLRRLIIDMPLRSVYPNDGDGPRTRPLIRAAFEQLQTIEEFVSVRDELYLATQTPRDLEPEVWSRWHHLRHLALYNAIIDEVMQTNLKSLPKLRTVVLTRPDHDFFQALDDLLGGLRPDVTVVLVNTREGHSLDMRQDGMEVNSSRYARALESSFTGSEDRSTEESSFAKLEVVVVGSAGGELDDIELCQGFIKDRTMSRCLWQ